MIVLGIESSCDETGVALYHSENGLVAHELYSQAAMHAEFGGVVPELASRDHVRKLVPLLKQLFEQAGICQNDIDAVAYTAGPGLIGALLVGAAFGRSLAWALDIPSIGVHHMEAHLLAPMLEAKPPAYPFLALLVSGGHTQLVQVDDFGQYTLLGETLDDAVGEAFDKTAKMLGLAYPGGPVIEKLAKQGRAGQLKFPRPMVDRPGLEFSFSGLKTATLNAWQKSDKTAQTQADIAHAFQTAVVDTLAIKCRRALEQTHLTTLVIAGGVGANLALRASLEHMVKPFGGQVYYPRIEFCTDNGAMVAYAGCQRLLRGEKDGTGINVFARKSM